MVDEAQPVSLRDIMKARTSLREKEEAITPVSISAVLVWIVGPLLLIGSDFLAANTALLPLLAVAAMTASWYGLSLLRILVRARRASSLLAKLRRESIQSSVVAPVSSG